MQEAMKMVGYVGAIKTGLATPIMLGSLWAHNRGYEERGWSPL
jgi:hypothetical protein